MRFIKSNLRLIQLIYFKYFKFINKMPLKNFEIFIKKNSKIIIKLYIRIISLEINQNLYPKRNRIRTLNTILSNYKTYQILIFIFLGNKIISISEQLKKAQKVKYITYFKLRKVKTGESSKGNSASKNSKLVNSNL